MFRAGLRTTAQADRASGFRVATWPWLFLGEFYSGTLNPVP